MSLNSLLCNNNVTIDKAVLLEAGLLISGARMMQMAINPRHRPMETITLFPVLT